MRFIFLKALYILVLVLASVWVLVQYFNNPKFNNSKEEKIYEPLEKVKKSPPIIYEEGKG